MDTTVRQNKNYRRQQLKKEILAWLTAQPDRMVREIEFRNKIGRLSDFHSLISSRDFTVLAIEGEKWVSVRDQQAGEVESQVLESVAARRQNRVLLTQNILAWLSARPEQKATRDEILQEFGSNPELQSVLYGGELVSFEYKGSRWLQPREYHETVFLKMMDKERRDALELAWQACIPHCGDLMRPDGSHGKSGRLYVIARTYTPESAAKRLGFATGVLRGAAGSGDIPAFIDPEGKTRIPAAAVEQAANSSEILEKISGNTILKARHIALVAGISYPILRNKLRKAHLSMTEPRWKEVCGQWGLPDSLNEYNTILAERYPIWLASVTGDHTEAERRPWEEFDAKKAQEREEARRLRQQLIEVFPTWDRDRTQQHITLHLGPTNSGKTFSGLSNLATAGSGWYLSPLRLLAHEVYETMNKRGVPCSLLTGEEVIEVPGAQVIAATIEMFNPHRSGECVIIDEAHMLADGQRGWAWTRAIMEAAAADIHVVGSPVSEALINHLAEELGFSVSTERYERLTPLNVAERPWTLEDLPARTILVAFSRRMVLGLKADLEKKFNRTVSVVYGNLPPEVRLRQAERFAAGETEICVATDAIGMGLNLPADNVCFFEAEKFDGKSMRVLNPNEIKQIAGRAGRFGLSEQGMVGGLSKATLDIIRQSLLAQNTSIGFAYVAPTPESLALLPGTLEEKLGQWVTLNGIPERWRKLLKPVDLSEQITLAGMLSPASVRKLGEKAALQLISAPCANNTEPYWLLCAKAIVARRPMPIPEADLPRRIDGSESLETYEWVIRCADIYLWLAQRREFSRYAPAEKGVRDERRRLSSILDDALAAKIDTTRRCRTCGRPIPTSSRHNTCERCFRGRRFQ